MTNLKESVVLPKDFRNLPKENLVEIVAKTTSPTIHKRDPVYPLRLFPEKELMLAARTLAQRPVGLNHKNLIEEAFVVNSDWNEETKEVEALLYLPTQYIDKVKSNDYQKVSVEYVWDEDIKQGEGTIFKGLKFVRVDLLEGRTPGDKGTSIQLFEDENHKGGRIIMPLKESEELTEEQIKSKIGELSAQKAVLDKKLYPESELSDEEKVAVQTDIDVLYAEIEAYKEKLVGKVAPEVKGTESDDPQGNSLDIENVDKGTPIPTVVPPPTTTVPTTIEPTVVEPKDPVDTQETDYGAFKDKLACELGKGYWYGETCHKEPEPEVIAPPDDVGTTVDTKEADAKMAALKEAVITLQKEVKKLKEFKANAKKEAIVEVCKAVEAKLPKGGYVTKWTQGQRALTLHIKKVLKELQE